MVYMTRFLIPSFTNTVKLMKYVFIFFTGVGKTSLVHLVSHSQPILNPYWTIGCSVEVKVSCQVLLLCLSLLE